MPVVGWIIREPRAAARKAVYWGRRQSKDASDFVAGCSVKVTRVFRTHGTSAVPEPNVDPGSSLPTTITPEPLSPSAFAHHRPSDAGTLKPISEGAISAARSADGSDEKTMEGDAASVDGQLTASNGKKRFANAVRSVMMLRTASAATSPRRQRTTSTDGARSGSGTPEESTTGMLRSSRVTSLVPKLRSLETTQDLAGHVALVRHLQFSPDGNFLATARFVRSHDFVALR